MTDKNSGLRNLNRDIEKLFSKIDKFEGNNLASEIDNMNLWINNIDYINENFIGWRIDYIFSKIEKVSRWEYQVSHRRPRRAKRANGFQNFEK